jgi:hypothetical protein
VVEILNVVKNIWASIQGKVISKVSGSKLNGPIQYYTEEGHWDDGSEYNWDLVERVGEYDFK